MIARLSCGDNVSKSVHIFLAVFNLILEASFNCSRLKPFLHRSLKALAMLNSDSALTFIFSVQRPKTLG